MKKIGIITFHYAHNYGALLQTIALQKVLNLNDKKNEVINYENENIANQYKIYLPYTTNFLKNVKRFITNFFFYKRRRKKYIVFEKFIKNNIYISNKINSIEELNNKKYDSIIVGSDQVWNINITNGYDDFYFLNCKNLNNKISYAASIGDNSILKNNINEFKKKIETINHISVREKSTEEQLKKIIKNDVCTTLDPTLLLNKEEWVNLFNKDRIIKEKYIFTYSVGKGNNDYYKAINKISKKYNYKVVYFDNNCLFTKINRKKINCYDSDPFKFLNLLYNSELVITSSFHGLAFSINFNKNFIVIPSNKPERLYNILNLLNIKNKTLCNDVDVFTIMNNKVEWGLVNDLLDKERRKSIDWLLNSLETGGVENNE